MRRLGLRVIMITAGLLGFWSGPAMAKLRTIDSLDKTANWAILDDSKASGSTRRDEGPKKGQRALSLEYKLGDGNWVAWVRELPRGLPGLKAVVLDIKGKGRNDLEIKLTDVDGATFGLKIPGGTSVSKWKKMVVPAGHLKYLWGGNTKVLAPDKIRKFEFTIATSGEGGSGKIVIANLKYSDVAMKARLPKPAVAAPGAPASTEQLDIKVVWPLSTTLEIQDAKDWKAYLDRGAALKLSTADSRDRGKKAVQAAFTWGPREEPGVREQTGNWVALVREVQLNLSEARSVSFTYKSTGAVANLEVKLRDKNGSNYGRTFPSGSSQPSWTTITIPRSDFKYMWGGDPAAKFDWDHVTVFEIALSRTNDSRDSGTFTLGSIRFQSAVSGVPTVAGKDTRDADVGQMQIMIDDFTDLNPAQRYYVIPGDDSSLALSSSRVTFEEDYSMRMEYVLKSSRPTGSWVEAQRRFITPLDWSGVKAVKIWVRGDSSRNIFRITLTDGENQKWIFDNNEILASTDWYLLDIPVMAFRLYKDYYRKGRSKKRLTPKLHTIKELSLGIVSQPNRSSDSQGEIFVEKLYVVGTNINASRAVPQMDKPPIGIAVPLKNWNLGGISNTVYDIRPNEPSVLNQNLLFKLNGNFDQFSVLGEIRLDSTFGNDGDGFRSTDGVLVSPNVSVSILEPFPGVRNAIFGNLWFNSSPHIFANDNQYGGWGFKGAMVEGWVDKLHHRTYYLQHAPDSYSLAGHYAMTLNKLNINLIGTYYNQQPFVSSATRLEQDDRAFLLDMSRKISIPGVLDITPRVIGGYNWFQKYWDVSTQAEVDERDGGVFLEGELNFSELSNIFWPGFSLTGKYRYVEPDFKPIFRRNPGSWDVEIGDQKGYEAQVYQQIMGAFLSAKYQKADRISSRDQGFENTVISVGYRDWSSLDLTLTQEFATKVYSYLNERFLWDGTNPATFYDNRREDTTRLHMTYHFSSNWIVSEEVEYKRFLQLDDNESYSEMFILTRIKYYPTPSLSFSLENKFSRLGRVEDINAINLIDLDRIPDYTWVRIDMTF